MGFTEYLWGWVTYFQAYFQWSKKCTLVLIGLDNAGKTSTLIRLSTDRMSNPVPTQMPGMEEVEVGNLKAKMFDLGGHATARRLWSQYFPSVNGIVFILDSTDVDRLEEAKEELSHVLKDNPTLPVLVLANKQDITQFALPEHEIRARLGLQLTSGKKTTKKDGVRSVELFPCSVLQDRGLREGMKTRKRGKKGREYEGEEQEKTSK